MLLVRTNREGNNGFKPLGAKQAIVDMLTKAGGGPRASELIAEALKLATGLKGNAKQTMYSAIYSDAKRDSVGL